MQIDVGVWPHATRGWRVAVVIDDGQARTAYVRGSSRETVAVTAAEAAARGVLGGDLARLELEMRRDHAGLSAVAHTWADLAARDSGSSEGEAVR